MIFRVMKLEFLE